MEHQSIVYKEEACQTCVTRGRCERDSDEESDRSRDLTQSVSAVGEPLLLIGVDGHHYRTRYFVFPL